MAKAMMLFILKYSINILHLGDVYAQIKYWRKHSLSLVVRILLNLCNMNSKAISLIGFLVRLWNLLEVNY